ncbi:hypothetical protein C9374_010094 [Naegleria lovaniensis]|uniref:Uncharacterized protein n=1 Tax=Naegleria lovaniensis TaxID=51637 RepID=A0AA88GCL0_NAELO|nr:uncharacterized protein C9374_010094 [Naegleria lovaniensis]KAG2375090.1 hypothetical protein C9374_010094 [Naegleria lovaniensis]
MFLFDWFFSLLRAIGILQDSIKGRVLFLGLDNAGKTTLLYKLKTGLMQQFNQTMYPNNETVEISSSCTIQVIDLGGHPLARKLWKDYYLDVSGIVFMVDAVERRRIQEARAELYSIMKDNDLANVPIVVMGNKVDNPNAMPEFELSEQLDVTHLRTGKSLDQSFGTQRPLEIFMTSVSKDFNIAESFEWLSSRIRK